MAGFITAAWIAAGALSTVAYETNRARSDEKKARKVAQKGAKLQAGRAAVEQVRQGQIARASILAQGENQGAGSSTAIAGAVGAAQSQTGGNLSFAQQIFSLQASQNRLLESAAGHLGRASDFQAIASIASSFAGGVPSGGGGSPSSQNGNLGGSNGSVDHWSNF